jgi:hypothetical protein
VIRIVPITLKRALRWCDAVHAHLEPPPGALVAVAVQDDTQRIVCVSILEVPSARMLGAQGVIAEISRVASDASTPNASGMATAALVRAAIALGYTRIVTYTMVGERGTTYRATGWRAVAISRGGHWDRDARPRDAATQPGAKVRWEIGPDALQEDPEVLAVVREMAGTVAFPERVRRTLPLFEVDS